MMSTLAEITLRRKKGLTQLKLYFLLKTSYRKKGPNVCERCLQMFVFILS